MLQILLTVVFFFLVLPQDLLVAVFHIEENFKILPLLSLILTALCALMRQFFGHTPISALKHVFLFASFGSTATQSCRHTAK